MVSLELKAFSNLVQLSEVVLSLPVPSNLFALLIISATEVLLGSGRIRGCAECDRATHSSTDPALPIPVAVFQGWNRVLFEFWLFFKDSNSWLIKGISGGARIVMQCPQKETNTPLHPLSLEALMGERLLNSP